MLYTLFFALGFLAAMYILPILDSLNSLLLTWLEAKKAKQSEIINLANIKMRQDATSADCSPMHAIGFQIPDDDYEEEDEE